MNREDLARVLANKISHPGCWSDMNRHHKIWYNLVRLSNSGWGNRTPIIKEEELPTEPNPADYPDNEC